MRVDWHEAAGADDRPAASAAVGQLLRDNRLLSMATVSPTGEPWANNVYFSYDNEFHLYFLTRPVSRHAENMRGNGDRLAATVADTRQDGVPGTRQGLQLAGLCRPARDGRLDRAVSSFAARFPAADLTAARSPLARADALRLYVFTVTDVTLFCEPVLGVNTWWPGRVSPARPARERRDTDNLLRVHQD